MAVRVCYVQRGAKGDAILGLRLVAERSQESWSAPARREDAPLNADVNAAADWLASKVRGSGDRLDVLCLDTEGSLCGWLSASSGDPTVLGALAREFGETPGHEGPSQRTALAETAATREEASVALLGDPRWPDAPKGRKAPASKPIRVGVLTVPDVPARLLADALDERGIPVGRVTTVWHALAAVWDPAARATSQSGTIDAATPTTAVVIADPAGRLHWVWSAGGTLLAAGSMRLAFERPAEGAMVEAGRTGSFPLRDSAGHVMVSGREASRLAAEWLSWSLELGRSPLRIIAITPPAAPGREAEHEAALTEFGQSLTKSMPGATMDLVENEDPLGATLTKLAERVDDATVAATPVSEIPGLATRPTRSHRRFLIVASLGITAMAAAAGTFAYKLQTEAGIARAASARAIENWRPAVREIDASLLAAEDTVPDKLNSLLRRLKEEQARPNPRTRAEVRPILDELATLTMVLGDPEVHLNEITFDSTGVNLRVLATLEQATALEQAFKDIAGSYLVNWKMNSTGRANPDGGFEYTFRGTWVAPEAPKPPAAGGKP